MHTKNPMRVLFYCRFSASPSYKIRVNRSGGATVDYSQELQTNPVVKLIGTDQGIIRKLMENQDPAFAESQAKLKLKQIGLNDKEIAIALLCYGMKFPVEKAMLETGLSRVQLDSYHDSAVAKINNFMYGTTRSPGDIKGLFADEIKPVTLGRVANSEVAPPWHDGNTPTVVKQGL